MPLGLKPVCSQCRVTSSTIWRKGLQGEVLCNSCGLKQQNGTNGKEATAPTNGNSSTSGKQNGNGSSSSAGPVLRKSARIKPTKAKYQTTSKPIATKGKGRRIIFKKTQPIKAPAAVATVVTGESIFFEGMYYQVGDIVSLVDQDAGVYYAQLRGFLQDQYCEKSAVITWLLPTTNSPKDRFDPSTYILGPEEDLPRKLSYMEFVCHAPSDYFKARNAPYPTLPIKPELSFIWTSIGPQIIPAPSIDEIFGVSSSEPQTPKSDKERVKEKEKPDKKLKDKDKDKEATTASC